MCVCWLPSGFNVLSHLPLRTLSLSMFYTDVVNQMREEKTHFQSFFFSHAHTVNARVPIDSSNNDCCDT